MLCSEFAKLSPEEKEMFVSEVGIVRPKDNTLTLVSKPKRKKLWEPRKRKVLLEPCYENTKPKRKRITLAIPPEEPVIKKPKRKILLEPETAHIEPKITHDIISKFKRRKSAIQPDTNHPQVVMFDDYQIKRSSLLSNRFPLHNFVEKCIDTLVSKNISPIQDSAVQEVLDYWNNMDNYRTVKHKSVNSIKGRMIQAVLTYRMHMNNIPETEVSRVIDGIALFNMISVSNGLLKYRKKLHLLDTFLWGESPYRKDKPWFDSCIKPLHEAAMDLYAYKSKYPKTLYSRTLPIFLEKFYPGDQHIFGTVEFFNNFPRFALWSEQMVEFHRSRFTCGLRVDQIIGLYFDFIKSCYENNRFGFVPSASFMLGRMGHFIRWMTAEPKYEEFGRAMTPKEKEIQRQKEEAYKKEQEEQEQLKKEQEEKDNGK